MTDFLERLFLPWHGDSSETTKKNPPCGSCYRKNPVVTLFFGDDRGKRSPFCPALLARPSARGDGRKRVTPLLRTTNYMRPAHLSEICASPSSFAPFTWTGTYGNCGDTLKQQFGRNFSLQFYSTCMPLTHYLFADWLSHIIQHRGIEANRPFLPKRRTVCTTWSIRSRN